MASLEQASKSGKQGEVRYLTPLDIETNEVKKVLSLQKVWDQVYRLQGPRLFIEVCQRTR